MKYFEFSKNVINRIINELQKANSYIRIAIFQLHNQEVFNVLKEKLNNGVEVEIFTLPYDSINENIQNEVIELFKNLKENGATLYFCKWNIGDPERTTMTIGRWYSFHGKFIVTDTSAIALSANFTQQNELDAFLLFENEYEKIEEYNRKFEELLQLFVIENFSHSGIIHQKIIDTNLPNVSSLFELPRVITTDIHSNHWIKDYPDSICPENIPIDDKLYITPFDTKGRNLIMNIISEAESFVYISTESFTDIDFSNFLTKTQLKKLDIRILTGATSMDFSDRIQIMLRELLANNIKIRTIEENLHAKLIITDRRVVISSINLNKMNLGFKKTKQLWRENTETVSICSNSDILSNAKFQYLEVFDNSLDISINLSEKIEKYVGNMFISIFGLRSKKEVKILFARLVLREEIKVKRFVINIGNITAKLMKYFNRTMIGKDDFLMALILYYLSERKHVFEQIDEKLSILNTTFNLENLLSIMLTNNFIEIEGNFYKIKLDSLF